MLKNILLPPAFLNIPQQEQYYIKTENCVSFIEFAISEIVLNLLIECDSKILPTGTGNTVLSCHI